MDDTKCLIATLKRRGNLKRQREEFDLFYASLVPKEQRWETLTKRTAPVLRIKRTLARNGSSATFQTAPIANANEHDAGDDQPDPISTLAVQYKHRQLL